MALRGGVNLLRSRVDGGARVALHAGPKQDREMGRLLPRDEIVPEELGHVAFLVHICPVAHDEVV
jgi:hypothetical protein